MNRVLALGSFALLLVMAASPANSAPIFLQGSPSCMWHGFVDEVELRGTPGSPYWDGNSWDSRGRVDDPTAPHNPASALALLEGHVVTTPSGGSLSLGADAPGQVDFWARPDLAGDHEVSFVNADGAALYQMKLLAEVTALPDNNEFGWYAPDAPDVLHPIFQGADGPGAVWNGVMPGEFGLYVSDAARQVLFRTQGSATEPQFAIFRMDTRLYVGVEDLFGVYPIQSDYDYNDLIVTFEAVPEPALLPAIGIGLAALARMAGRRRPRA